MVHRLIWICRTQWWCLLFTATGWRSATSLNTKSGTGAFLWTSLRTSILQTSAKARLWRVRSLLEFLSVKFQAFALNGTGNSFNTIDFLDNVSENSYMFSQLCLCSAKWKCFYCEVFQIWLLVQQVTESVVGGLVG